MGQPCPIKTQPKDNLKDAKRSRTNIDLPYVFHCKDIFKGIFTLFLLFAYPSLIHYKRNNQKSLQKKKPWISD